MEGVMGGSLHYETPILLCFFSIVGLSLMESIPYRGWLPVIVLAVIAGLFALTYLAIVFVIDSVRSRWLSPARKPGDASRPNPEGSLWDRDLDV
jgi:hypothetical protein